MRLLATALIGLLIAATPPATDDSAKIQGGWYVHAQTTNGNEIESYSGAGPDWVFSGDRIRMYGKDAGTFRLDPSKDMKTIDINGPRVGVGIYKLEGDTLTICFVESPRSRPVEFTSPPGANRYLTAYRRTPKKSAAVEPKGELSGVWELTEQTGGGIRRETLGKSLLAFRGDAFAREDSQGRYSGHFTFDAKATPKTVDLTPTGGDFPADGRRTGIYKVEGDTLTICDTEASGNRPTEFKSPWGSKVSLSVYRRMKK